MYLPNILLNAVTGVLAASDSQASISVDDIKTLSLGLFVILGAIFVLKTLFYDIPGKRKNDASSQSQDTQIAVSSAEAVSAVSESSEDDTQLIAVITAAVAAYMEAENQADGIVAAENINTSFRVVSFKRKSGGEWNRSSR